MFLRAKTSDHAALLSWIERYCAYDHIPFELNRVSTATAALLESDQYGVAFFVQLNEKTVGYFILTYGYDIEYGGVHATLTDLYFSEDARRSGAGTKTIKFIEDFCREKNLGTLFLQVEIDNIHAQSFYKKVGFRLNHRYTMTKAITQ